jgi:putative transcriptional regulator
MIEKLKQGLEKRDFEVLPVWGMGFDLIARRKGTYIIKYSENINSIKAAGAHKIKKIAGFLKSFAVIVGSKINDELMDDNVVYHRYGIPALNETTFYSILDGEMPRAVSGRGGITIEIDSSKIGDVDVDSAAQKLGVSKRNIFYYMSGDISSIKPERLENFKSEFGDVFKHYEMKRFELDEREKYQFSFVHRLDEMGFENMEVNMSACDLLSRLHEFGLASKVGNSEWTLRYHADRIKHASSALGLKPLFVLRTRRKLKKEIKDIPTISTKTIGDSSPEEFLEIVEA